MRIPWAFPLLQQEFDRPELALDELKRRSLVDRDSFNQGRAALVSLVREARLHQLSKSQREQIEQRVADLYTSWLYELQQYQDDAEQAALIAELVVLYSKQRRWLQAAELLIPWGWLCVQLGHMNRIERYAPAPSSSPLDSDEQTLRTFFQQQVRAQIGQRTNAQDRYRVCQTIYKLAQSSKIHLQPHTIIHIAHEMLLPEVQTGHYEQALGFLEEVLDHIIRSRQISAEVRASWNQSKARVLARWAEVEEKRGNVEKALALKRENVAIIKETLELWQECLSSASALHQKVLEKRLGRSYNDYAYRQRLLGDIDEAYDAIRKCLVLKQDKRAARPRSLAVALGEYAQILAARGALLRADEENAQALSIQEELLEKGDKSVAADVGMLKIERGNILMQQARIAEARPLFEEGKRLIGDTAHRQKFLDEADKQIRIVDASTYYRLDARWSERYFQLSRYDDTEWLSPAGLFTDREWREWDALLSRKQEEEARSHMDEIILRSRKRALARSFEEQEEPSLHYPAIQVATVDRHIIGFEQLLAEITAQEQHAIVRKLYQERIQEQLTLLHMYKAISQRDNDRVWQCNQQLFGIPSREEVEIALRPLVSMLIRAQSHPEAGPLARNLLAEIKTWDLHQDLFLPGEGTEQDAPKRKPMPKVAPEIAKLFFEDMLYSFYHFHNWEVCISSTRNIAHIEPNLRRFILPQREYTIVKLRGLLAEEIETHAYRAESGYASSLMLLGSGTAGYRYTEEALATRAKGEQENQKKSWMGTLTAGLMAGVVSPPFSFLALVNLLANALSVRNLRGERYVTAEEAEQAAKEEALDHVLRAVRGVPDLTRSGVCCLLDRVYLKGHLDLSDFLKTGGNVERLFVGKIGIADLPAMEEIHLLKPAIPQQRLAENLDIYDYIKKIEERCKLSDK